jgi:hypothetical protein
VLAFNSHESHFIAGSQAAGHLDDQRVGYKQAMMHPLYTLAEIPEDSCMTRSARARCNARMLQTDSPSNDLGS